MKTKKLIDFPANTQVRGFLYEDPGHEYLLGDVLEIELSSGWIIDVGWNKDYPDRPFRIAVYREYFGDRIVDFRVREIDDVVKETQRLALEYS